MKLRIDRWLVEHGYFSSREQAQRSIMAGEVFINGKRVDQASKVVDFTEDKLPEVTVQSTSLSYVSRGGHKLEKGLAFFNLPVSGKVCLDAGASTGGFTDCLLRAGASRVYAVDVGYGQLAWKLRQDPRVALFERENIRYFTPERLEERPSLITADLSFISLELVLAPLKGLLASDGGDLVTLIKPQFEAGREKVGKKGVVRKEETHREILERLTENGPFHGWKLVGLTFSPLLGPEGNIEYLGHWRPVEGESLPLEKGFDITTVVQEAWQSLGG